jgi:hypothetical protein
VIGRNAEGSSEWRLSFGRRTVKEGWIRGDEREVSLIAALNMEWRWGRSLSLNRWINWNDKPSGPGEELWEVSMAAEMALTSKEKEERSERRESRRLGRGLPSGELEGGGGV